MTRGMLLLALGMMGCTGAQSALEGRLAGIETRLRDLERSATAQRQQVLNLENRMMLLQDQMETRQLAAGRTATASVPANPTGTPGSTPPPTLGIPRSLPSVRLVPPQASHTEPEEDEEEEEGAEPESPSPPGSRRSRVSHPDTMPDVYATLTDDGRVVSSPERPRDGKAQGRVRPVPRGGDPTPEVGDDRVLTAYRDAYEAYQQGRLDEAMTAFREFVQRHPRHPYADNAQYWIGECFYDRGDWAQARREFLRVVTEHPDGNKVPDAMVKVGLCDQRLNQWDEARRMYDAVLLTYPDSPAAAVAVRLLGELP